MIIGSLIAHPLASRVWSSQPLLGPVPPKGTFPFGSESQPDFSPLRSLFAAVEEGGAHTLKRGPPLLRFGRAGSPRRELKTRARVCHLGGILILPQ
jgi:hypothetical protein